MNTRHRLVGDPVRNSGGRWRRHLVWLAALVAALSLIACEQEQVRDLPVTAVPTKAQGTYSANPNAGGEGDPAAQSGGVQPATSGSSLQREGPGGAVNNQCRWRQPPVR